MGRTWWRPASVLEDVEVPGPDEIAMRPCVEFRKMLTTRRLPPGAGSHAVVMVPEFVKEDVEKLVRSECAFCEVKHMTLCSELDGHAKAVKDVAVLIDVPPVADDRAKAARLSADRDEAGAVVAVTVLARGCEKNRVEAHCERSPIGENVQERPHVADEQDVSVARSRRLSKNLRVRTRPVEVARRRSGPGGTVLVAGFHSGRGFHTARVHRL